MIPGLQPDRLPHSPRSPLAGTTRRAQSVHGLALVGNPDIHPALRTHGRNSISWCHQKIRLVDRCYGVRRTIRAGDGLLAIEFPCHS